MYNQIVDALAVTRHEQRIEADSILSANQKFDLITGFMVCFNNHNRSDLWHISEWDQFLDNVIQRNLSRGGRIFFALNPEKDKNPIDLDLVAFFRGRGAQVDGLHVSLEPLP